jgi:hypothetical protein
MYHFGSLAVKGVLQILMLWHSQLTETVVNQFVCYVAAKMLRARVYN